MQSNRPASAAGSARDPWRTTAIWGSFVLAALIAVADSAVLAPWRVSGDYQPALVAAIGSAVLTALLLVVLLRWPAERRVADALLVLGASMLTLGVVYQLGVEVLFNLINANNPPFALPSGPSADPVLETGVGAVGAWLLASGLGRLGDDAPSPSRMVQMVVLAAGLVAALLIAASATLPGWAPEYRVAVLVSALGALGWAALARATLVARALPAGRWLVFSGAFLTLLRVSLNALVQLTRAHDTGMLENILGLLAWALLCAGFALITSQTSSLRVLLRSEPNVEVRNGPARP